MVEWFKNLSEGWQTAIFGAGVAVALAVIVNVPVLVNVCETSHPPVPLEPSPNVQLTLATLPSGSEHAAENELSSFLYAP